jgi:hypothetical protein
MVPVQCPEISFLQVDRLEVIAASGQQGLDGAVGQQRAQGKAHVGRLQDLSARRTDDLRQALAAEFRRMLKTLPAAFGVLAVGLLEAWRGGDDLPSWKDDGYLSPSQFSGAITLSLSLAHSSSTAWAVSSPASSNPGICAIWSMRARCSMLKSMSLTGAM